MKRLHAVLAVVVVLSMLLSACAAPAAAPAAPAAPAAGDAAAATATEEAAAPAADAAASGDQKSICFAFQDLETEFWVAGHKAITETLRDQGIEVIERNANEDANRQLEQVERLHRPGRGWHHHHPAGRRERRHDRRRSQQGRHPDRRSSTARRPTRAIRPLVIVADNERIRAGVSSITWPTQAKKLGRKVTPLILVGDLGDTNAVGRREGLHDT